MAIKDLQALVASISHDLNAAGIPCVLWGHFLLQVHGVPTIIGSIDFVIPDDLLEAGARALNNIDIAEDTILIPCPSPSDCSITRPKRPTPPPSIHRHFRGSEVYVGIYRQRDTLWFIPPLGGVSDCLLSPATQQLPPPFVLASDQTALPPRRLGRGDGFFRPGKSPVVAVKAHILLEAFIRIYARDVGTTIGLLAIVMIGYMEMYVEDDGFLDADQLPDLIKTVYRKRRHEKMPLRQWTQELKEALSQHV